ncbi:MAG: hypothetical protein SF029_21855 [bacterium]|nr:hypothetical protein [bacterium]
MQKRKRKTVSLDEAPAPISPLSLNFRQVFLALTVGIVILVVLGEWTASSLLSCLAMMFVMALFLAFVYAIMRNVASAFSFFRNPTTAFFEQQGFVVSQGVHPEYGTAVTQVTLPDNPSDKALQTQQMIEALYQQYQEMEKAKNDKRDGVLDDTSHLDEMLGAGWINQDEYDRIKGNMTDREDE